jgi:very-short-patch-repair endonuclease
MKLKYNNNLIKNAKKLRGDMTKQEKHLWYDFLSNYPIRFLRQKPIDNYIVDFYCRKAELVVELDGSQHYKDDAVEYDKKRTAILEKHNIEVMRISNYDLNCNFQGVCKVIDIKVKQRIKGDKND